MAIITSTVSVSDSSFFSDGKTYTWTVLKLASPLTIDTLVTNITATTIDISYEGDLLPLGVTELTECNLQDPTLVPESCCDVFFYDFPDATGLADLVTAGIPAIVALGRNIIRVGPNFQYPNEIWEYSKSGDPQTLSNWYRVEILSTTWGTQVVASDSTLTGLGTVGDPLGLAVVPLSFTQAHDPALLGDGAKEEVVIAAAGVVFGDYVRVSYTIDTQGIDFKGRVSSAGNVTVTIQNETGGAIDLAAATINVSVLQA